MCICIYVYMYIRIYEYMYISMYICMYIYGCLSKLMASRPGGLKIKLSMIFG